MLIDKIFESDQAVKDRWDFESKWFFSRGVSLDYKAVSQQPWVYFNCVNNDKHSFAVHELEFGAEEAIRWNMTAQKNKEIKFEGFANILYSFGYMHLRGYLSIPENDYKIGVVIRNKRLLRLRNVEDIEKERLSGLANKIGIMMLCSSLKK